jgi:aspartyl-tRNA(Asn)/glutamyl-tRNA(Gln) amidotransferase subunit A
MEVREATHSLVACLLLAHDCRESVLTGKRTMKGTMAMYDVSAGGNARPLVDMGLSELAQAIRCGSVTATQAVDASLQSIAALDPALNAFCTLDADQARQTALALDKRLARGELPGPLAGVPVAIKDLICTKGLRTTFGSRLYAEHMPDEDDVVVARLKAAGAIVVGKTNTSEFGYGAVGHNPLFATTRNPWHNALTPGGSSAGSAVAIASRMLTLAIGSDGGGSVRVPASLCGVFGIKPSWGRVPVYPGCRDERYPGVSSWESLEHIGPITRTAADAALAMTVLVGPAPCDRHSIPAESADWAMAAPETLRHIRIAVSPDLGFALVDPQVRKATLDAAQCVARTLGCQVDLAHPQFDNPAAMFETLVALDTDRKGLRDMAAERGITLTGWLARLLAREWTGDEFTHAIIERKRIVNATWRFMQRYDFLLTPTTASPAFGIDLEGPTHIAGQAVNSVAWLPFSSLANLTGLPAASVPAGFTKERLPIGLQIMGRHLDDRGVLALSAVVESLYPMCEQRPPVCAGRRVGVSAPVAY